MTLDDQASDREEQFREAALQTRKPEVPKATGRCLNCDEPTPGRFCDTDCRDDWQKREGRA